MDQVLTEGREVMAGEVKERLQRFLDNYGTGITVTQVNLQSAAAPREVQEAFDDVIRAREDEQREKNQAESYANGVVPEARGQAQRMLEEASGYRDAVISRAQGEADRFSKLLTEYRKAPEVTRERLYLETMQEVMSNTSKVMVTGENGRTTCSTCRWTRWSTARAAPVVRRRAVRPRRRLRRARPRVCRRSSIRVKFAPGRAADE